MKMHKILFFVTGIGLGDAVREYAIIKELKKRGKFKIKIAGYKTSYHFFKNKFPTIKIKGFDTTAPRFKFEFSNFMKRNILLPITWNAQIKKLKKEIRKFKPDLIVTDFEPLGILFAKNTNTKFVEVFGVDPVDFDEFLKERKRDLFTEMQIMYLKTMYEQGNNYGKAVIIGSFSKRKNFKNFKFVSPIVRKSKKGTGRAWVIILGGSSFGVAMGKHLTRILPKINKERFFVFGSSKKKKVKNCTFLPPTEGALEYMKNAEGIISLAGHLTISEALVLKKPLLVFPIPNHIEQAYNAWLLKKKKLAMVKELKSINEKVIEETMRKFIKQKSQLKRKVSRIKIKSNGAEQAAKIISDILQ